MEDNKLRVPELMSPNTRDACDLSSPGLKRQVELHIADVFKLGNTTFSDDQFCPCHFLKASLVENVLKNSWNEEKANQEMCYNEF